MFILTVILTSLFASLALFIISKIIGYRQVSELSMYDYINGITIGSIAADVAVTKGEEFLSHVIAMVIFGGVTVLFSIISNKSLRFRRLFEGTPAILFSKGRFCEENMKKAKIDINEFQMELRINGYFDLSEIDTVILEPNGKLSILPISGYRPLEPSDMYIQPKSAEVLANVIIDGVTVDNNLRLCGFDKNWLNLELKKQKAPPIKEILLATLDRQGKLTFYKKGEKTVKNMTE